MKLFDTLLALSLLCASVSACGAGEDNFLKVDTKSRLEQTLDFRGGELTIPVNSNCPYTATVTEGADWCHAAVNMQKVVVTVDPYEGSTDRKARIVLEAKGCKNVEAVINQNVIVVENLPEAFRLTNGSLSFGITIATCTELKFEHPEWVKPIDTAFERGSKTYTFRADSFLGGESDTRSGELVISNPASPSSFEKRIPIEQTSYSNEAISKLARLWSLAPESLQKAASNSRYAALARMEQMSEGISGEEFKAYLDKAETAAERDEQNIPILSCYRFAFDRVLSDIIGLTPEQGTAYVWEVYNMGFVVKTPSVCFGIDINHRLAVQMAPYRDFLCITHNHNDHKDNALAAKMVELGKPVLSNFYATSANWCATVPMEYNIGKTKILTAVTDHGNDPIAVTLFRIKCGEDSGNFEIVHCGDSSFDTSLLGKIEGPGASLLVLRFGQKVENDIIGTGSGQVKPECVFMSHMIELRHNIDKSPSRATILGTINNMYSNITGVPRSRTLVPFWGERFKWDGTTLKGDI